jgi:Cyclic nucleotide-binding domain
VLKNQSQWDLAMNFGSHEMMLLSNCISVEVTESTFVAKLLAQFGLDPSNITLDEIANRVAEAALASLNIAHMLALAGAVFFVGTLLMRTMVPLRICGIISDVFFIGYGVLAHSVTTIFLYILILPINVFRLYQMLKLVDKARIAAQGDLSIDWLKPFMTHRKYKKGDVVLRKGDIANEMFIIVTGRFLVTDLAIELPPGRLVGELGFLAPNNRRTQTVECTEDGRVLTIAYDRLLELYFQNPEFGYYLLRLSSERLLENMARLETMLADRNRQEYAAQGHSPKDK